MKKRSKGRGCDGDFQVAVIAYSSESGWDGEDWLDIPYPVYVPKSPLAV